MKAIGGLKELLGQLANVNDENIFRIVFSTFTIDLKWFYQSVYKKLPSFQSDKLLVFFGNGDGNFINYEMPVLGKFKKFVFVKPSGGLFHPKFIYVELRNKIYFGLGSSNLVGGSYSSTNLEFQQIFEFDKSQGALIQGILANFMDEIVLNVSDAQSNLLKNEFKDWQRSTGIELDQSFFPNTKKSPLLETIKKFHSRDPLIAGWCLSPFLSNREVVKENITKSIALDNSLINTLLSLGIQKINIYSRSAPSILKAHPEVHYYRSDFRKDFSMFHAKASVFETASGKFLVVWGSSNFTDSAWLGRNFEMDFIEVLDINPFEEFFNSSFIKTEPTIVSAEENSEEDVFINSCEMDCNSKRLSIELSCLPKGSDISVQVMAGDTVIVSMQKLTKIQNKILITKFKLEEWVNAPRAEVHLYINGELSQQIYPFLLGIPEEYFNPSNGEVILPKTTFEFLDILLYGKYVPSQGGDNIDDTQDNEEVLSEEEVSISNIDNHMGLSDVISRYLSAAFTELFLKAPNPHELKLAQDKFERVMTHFEAKSKNDLTPEYEKRFMNLFVASYQELKLQFDKVQADAIKKRNLA